MRTLLALVGPTASGKSRMAVELAQALGGVEIVSCDSMAVYRSLDVVAAKPTRQERAAVPHHCIDIAEACESFTAVRYRAHAREAIDEIGRRTKTAMLVGGSGLYFRAVVDELEFAPEDASVRARLQASDPKELYRRLQDADPVMAASLDARNVRRVVRAVEILELTGKPPSERRRTWTRRDGPYDLTAVGLTRERDELVQRAEARLRSMVDEGLLAEVSRAADAGLSATASQAVGVKEMLEHLSGRISLDEAVRLYVRNVRRFIGRQLSWFRGDPRVSWVDVSALGWNGARGAALETFRAAVARRAEP